MYHTAQLKTEMALKTEKIPPQKSDFLWFKSDFLLSKHIFDDYYRIQKALPTEIAWYFYKPSEYQNTKKKI